MTETSPEVLTLDATAVYVKHDTAAEDAEESEPLHTSPEGLKLIICSLLHPPGTTAYALVQAWSLESLEDNLRRQRRLRGDFLPVAAFLAEPEALKSVLGLPHLPCSIWAEHAARWFGRTPIIGPAQPAIFTHYTHVVGVASLFEEWARAVRAVSVTSAGGA